MPIVTLTANPAIDLACSADVVRPVHKIRTKIERIDAGGGGINVARVLHALGEDVVALVMTGGVTGQLIERALDDAGVPWRAVHVAGDTRIVMNVREDESGLEYRFVPPGPDISAEEWRAQLDELRHIEADWLVASGCLPPGAPDDYYAQAARIVHAHGQSFALDTSGPALRAALDSNPDLLKLSLSELEYLAGENLPSAAAQENAVAALLRQGVRMIAVSLGRDGALLATGGGIDRMGALRVVVRGAVGAGDSFMAGLVLGLRRRLPRRKTLALAMAAGCAAVSRFGTAQVVREEVETLYRRALANHPIPRQ